MSAPGHPTREFGSAQHDGAPVTAGAPPVIAIAGVQKTYRTGTHALAPVDLAVRRGGFLTLLGPSGCGKTTLLNVMAGLIAPDAGTLSWWGGGFDATGGPGRRLAMVFQAPTLMPWARVDANVRLPLDLAHVPRAAAAREVDAALALVGLSDFARHFPRELSGGMQIKACADITRRDAGYRKRLFDHCRRRSYLVIVRCTIPGCAAETRPKRQEESAMEASKVPVNQTGSNIAIDLMAESAPFPHYAPELSRDTHRAVAKSGLCAGLGFVGASILAAGLLLVNGGAGVAIALALVVAGGAVATFGWRNAWKVLADLEPRHADATTAAVPTGAASGGANTAVAERIAAAHPRTALAGY